VKYIKGYSLELSCAVLAMWNLAQANEINVPNK
jgi:hypothetical protein